jgi:DNA-binding XRE family transcriptional regulator
MAKNTADLERKIRSRPGAAERIDAQTLAMQTVHRLVKLREELDATQVEMAAFLKTSQANVSQIERSQNPYLITLANYVDALGGKLEINAVFEDRVIPLAAVENQDAPTPA